MKQNKLGMMYGTLGDAKAYKEGGANVALTGQPVVTPGWEGNVGAWMDLYSIMSGSKHPDEAWLFLKFLTEEVALMKANGSCEVCGNAPSIVTQAKEWAGDDPMRQDTFKLLQRVVPPPFSPDIWTAVDPFYEAFRLMTEEKADPAASVKAAADECQTKLDELWETYEISGPAIALRIDLDWNIDPVKWARRCPLPEQQVQTHCRARSTFQPQFQTYPVSPVLAPCSIA